MFKTTLTMEHPGAGILHLEGAATIEFGKQLHRALREALDRTQTLSVSVAKLTAIDVCGLQLLCAAHRSALLNYQCLSLGRERSAAFAAQVRETGFHSAQPGTCLRAEGQTCLWAESPSAIDCEAL